MALKLVCDTNTLISGFLWRGSEFELLAAMGARKALLFSSPALFSEFVRVLSYERIRSFVSDPEAVVRQFRDLAVFVNPRHAVDVVKEDSSDNRVLECALGAQADLIVSGDKHLLKLGAFRDIPIVRTKKALHLIAD